MGGGGLVLLDAFQLVQFLVAVLSLLAVAVLSLLAVVFLVLLAVVFLALWTYYRVNGSLVNVSPEPDQNAQLVARGLYARIRHPIYLGVILSGLGVALIHGHFVPLVIALLFVPFFTYKSMFEERWLMQVYADYAAYRQRAGRFLPRWSRQE